jgi:myosin heavy subunit
VLRGHGWPPHSRPPACARTQAELQNEAETDHGDWTWVPHPTEFWQAAQRTGDNADGSVTCRCEDGSEVVVPRSRKMQDAATGGRLQEVPLWKMAHGDLVHPVDDLIMLEQVNDGSIIHNLKVTYAKSGLYTWVGASHRVLVSINPYQRLPLYGVDVVKAHREKSPNIEIPPHVFDIANDSYDEMLFEGKHQSILISGESGAGKTEATKQCLKFWANVAGSKNGVEERLIQVRAGVMGGPLAERLAERLTCAACVRVCAGQPGAGSVWQRKDHPQQQLLALRQVAGSVF